MTAHIYQEDLDFLEEAKQVFESDIRRETHRNEDGDLIALRRGSHRDCINVFRLGEELLMCEILPSAQVQLVQMPIEEIMRLYKAHKTPKGPATGFNDGLAVGIEMTLNHLGVKIEGVNC